MTFLSTLRTTGLAVAAAAALALTGCAGGGGSGGSEADGGAPEKGKITVAINPSTQFAPMYYGIEQGIFEDHGLELEIVPQTDIAAIISGIASGQYDIGFATIVHVLTANANDIPIRAVATLEGQIQEDDSGTLTIAGADTGITGFDDLEGKTVATVGLSSHNTLTLWELAERNGVDPKSIELVQLPFGQMAAALESGEVDAAVMQWPFADDALDAGGVELGYNNRELFEGTATTYFNTSQQFIDANPNTVKAFSDSMIASIEAANDDPDAARESLVTGMDMTEEQAEIARWNIGGDPHANLDGFETARDLIVKFSDDAAVKSALEELDVSTVVWPGALDE